jgi:hypothetical protein
MDITQPIPLLLVWWSGLHQETGAKMIRLDKALSKAQFT